MNAQAAVVASFPNESGAASRDVIWLRTLLADCSAKYHEATQFEEAITRRLYNEEHFSRIEMQIAESATAASEDWASRFSAAKHHHECQVALMSAEELQLRAKLAKAPEHFAAEETSTSELRVMSNDVHTMLSAMEEIAQQRDSALPAFQSMTISRKNMEESLANAYSMNAELKLQLR